MIYFLYCDSQVLTDEPFCEIINNCPEIRSICLRERPKITHKTIDALISLAERKPKSDFVHSFGYKPYNYNKRSEQNLDYLEFLTDKKYENVPKNLNIIQYNYDMYKSFEQFI